MKGRRDKWGGRERRGEEGEMMSDERRKCEVEDAKRNGKSNTIQNTQYKIQNTKCNH